MNDPGHCCTDDAGTERANPPSQPAVRYRIGTQSSFLRRMLHRLSRQVVPPDGDAATAPRPLRGLTTRDDDDGTIAILDAFACVCDVLTFYTERGFNEGFLRTAIQRRSVFEMARSIGYQPGPGVAASTRLAFSLDDAEGAAERVVVPAGTAVMSVPGPDEEPQTFETIEDVDARPPWNTMAAATTRRQRIGRGTEELYLAGVATRLTAGDVIAVIEEQRASAAPRNMRGWDVRVVTEVRANIDADRTWVRLDRPLGHRGADPGRWWPGTEHRVVVFRDRGSLFGYNAPDFRALNDDLRARFSETGPPPWPKTDTTLADDATTRAFLGYRPPRGVINLDREYPKVLEGSWVCLQDKTCRQLYRVDTIKGESRTDFTLTAKLSRLFLDHTGGLAGFRLRSTTVHLASQDLPLTDAPWTEAVSGQLIELAERVPPLPPDRQVFVTGLDEAGAPAVELAVVQSCDTVRGGERTRIRLAESLEHRYQRHTVRVSGNVAAATHGETIAREFIGSGNAAAAHQSFALRQTPLTFVPAPTPSGGRSTATIRIDGVEWQPVDQLYGAGAADNVYELRVAHEGTAVVQLGDGVQGARATTGTENVVAAYRKGTGLAGEVDADQLSVLRTRPVGVTGVTNPMPAVGAADPEGPDDIRTAAPLRVSTLDRLVSVQDYEDYARAFAGIGKASAQQLWDGRQSLVHLTVASASGRPLAPTDDTRVALQESIERYRDPAHVVQLASFVEARFAVRMRVLADPALVRADVEANIVRVLGERFSFAERRFGDGVAASQVVAAAHDAEGVRAVTLEALYRGTVESLSPLLPAALPRWDGPRVAPAELLLIDPGRIVVRWMP